MLEQLFLYLKTLLKFKKTYKSLNWITISSQSIKHNFSIFQFHKQNYTIIPVVKSNAYGHGLKQIVQILNTIPECKLIAVDSYPEYQIIYKNSTKNILIMSETWLENYKLFDTQRTHFAVRSLDIIPILGELKKNIQVHIFINSGMNREGVKPGKQLEELVSKIQHYKNIKIVGIMSHLACADDRNHKLNKTQSDIFYNALSYLHEQGIFPEYIHLEASAGMINNIDSHKICTAGRLGLGLYGLDPLYSHNKLSSFGKKLMPALDVYSSITCLQSIKENESIGYSGTRQAEHDQIIGTFPFGYREGLDRGLSGKGWNVKIGEGYHEIIGRISMNYAGFVGNSNIKKGDVVNIISSSIENFNSIYNFYDKLGKIPYEVVKLDDKIKKIVI